jgi:hypothetical protein
MQVCARDQPQKKHSTEVKETFREPFSLTLMLSFNSASLDK